MPQPAPSAAPAAPRLADVLVRECTAMVRHLLTNGGRVPPALVQTVEQLASALEQKQPVDVAALAAAHEKLAKLVAPARPGTLCLLEGAFQGRDRWSALGPVAVARQMVRVAFACVAVFIVLSVMALVDADPGFELLPAKMIGVKTALEHVFWLSAAGIGASFAMLFKLSEAIADRTIDPDETQSYWVKFFLGMVAGFVLVALVPVQDQVESSGAKALAPATIALLGGFSAQAVYRILNRLVEALESVFSGGAREEAAAREQAAAGRAEAEAAQARVDLAGKLMGLQQQVAAGAAPDDVSARLRQLVAELVPSAGGGEASASADPASRSPARVPALAVVGAPAEGDGPGAAG